MLRVLSYYPLYIYIHVFLCIFVCICIYLCIHTTLLLLTLLSDENFKQRLLGTRTRQLNYIGQWLRRTCVKGLYVFQIHCYCLVMICILGEGSSLIRLFGVIYKPDLIY